MAKLIYDETKDYISLLLLFAKEHKVWGESTDYHHELTITIANMSKKPFSDIIVNKNLFWFRWYSAQIAEERKLKAQRNEVMRSLEIIPDLGQWIFMTVGFDDKTNIDGYIMLSMARKICNVNLKKGQPLFISGIFNLEKHRKDEKGKNYIHHHAHFLLNLAEHTRPGKIAELVFKVSGLRQYCKEQNFIDVKTPNAKDYKKRAQPYPVCDNYINGLKSGEKAECVGADILWRQSLGLETIYEHKIGNEN